MLSLFSGNYQWCLWFFFSTSSLDGVPAKHGESLTCEKIIYSVQFISELTKMRGLCPHMVKFLSITWLIYLEVYYWSQQAAHPFLIRRCSPTVRCTGVIILEFLEIMGTNTPFFGNKTSSPWGVGDTVPTLASHLMI